jgi:hypothetical protein
MRRNFVQIFLGRDEAAFSFPFSSLPSVRGDQPKAGRSSRSKLRSVLTGIQTNMGARENLSQLKVLIRKNLWLQKRSPIATGCELVLPIIIAFMTVGMFYVFTQLGFNISPPPQSYSAFE